MNLIESYLTIKQDAGPFEFKEKASRFISFAFYVTDVGSVDFIIKDLRKKYYDARHVCYAYRIGEGVVDLFRYNDDGEPGGTAGFPIYKEIERGDIFNILIVSIRYFGGVKLGTGGLTRAYSRSAKLVLDNIERKEIIKVDNFSLMTPFDFMSDIMYIINSTTGTVVLSQNYNEQGMVIDFSIPVKKVDQFEKLLIDKSSGRFSLFQCDKS